MGMQVTGKADFIAHFLRTNDIYGMIVEIIKTLPGAPVIMVVVLLTMIAFYATSFDSIALTASCYSYHRLGAPQADPAHVVHPADSAAHRAAVRRKLHDKPAIGEYRCGVPHRHRHCDDRSQLLKGCKKIS